MKSNDGYRQDLITATEEVVGRGNEIMKDLDEVQAARLALYLLDQAGLTIEQQTRVLAIAEFQLGVELA